MTKKKVNKSQNIADPYLDYKKPDWVCVGALCNVRGEAYDIFEIMQVVEKGVILSIGYETFDKLHRRFIDHESS